MSSTDLQMTEILSEEVKEEKFDEKKPIECPSKCHVCLSFGVILLMCLVGFNATTAGILSNDWKKRFGLTYEQLAKIWLLDGVGIMFGSAICSLLLCIESCLGFALGALIVSIFPYNRNFLCLQLSGLGGGFGRALTLVYGTHILSSWPKSSALVLIQLSFISYSFGGLLACQFSEYYASLMIVWKSNVTLIEVRNSSSWSKQDELEMSKASEKENYEVFLMQVVIIIACLLAFLLALIRVQLRCCWRKNINTRACDRQAFGAYHDFQDVNESRGLKLIKKSSDIEDLMNVSSHSWFAPNRVLDVSLIMFVFTHFLFAFGMESILAKFLCFVDPSFPTGKQDESKKPAISFIYSVFCGLTVLGRFLSITFSKSYSSTAIVAICLATNVVATTIMSAYSDKSESLTVFCIAVFSAFLSPLLPAGLTWSNSYLSYCPRSLGLAFFCAGVGCASFSWIAGLLMNKFSEMHLMFFITGACCLSCITYVPLLVRVQKVNENQSTTTVTYV